MPSALDDILALALAFLLGAVLGAEREWRRHPGGLRSAALAAVASCAFARILIGVGGNNLAAGFGALATGIGFLGAGVILRSGERVRGLSSAASFWAVAAMGAAIGAGFATLGIVLAVLILVTHVVLRRVSIWIEAHAPPEDPGPH